MQEFDEAFLGEGCHCLLVIRNRTTWRTDFWSVMAHHSVALGAHVDRIAVDHSNRVDIDWLGAGGRREHHQ